MADPKKAIRMFRLFHSRDWRGEGDFHKDLMIPGFIYRVGDAVNTDYESDKLNPETGEDEGWIPYTHEHDAGVGVYMPRGELKLTEEEAEADRVTVPAWIRNTDQMTWLGRCLGFRFREEGGRVVEAKGTKPLPELYASPSGKALFVIQNKRRLIAIIWGGSLAVERRGIVH